MKPDMSPWAVTERLKRVSQITRTCLQLRRAQFVPKNQKIEPKPSIQQAFSRMGKTSQLSEKH